MKVVLRLAILAATLLLVSNMAFAFATFSCSPASTVEDNCYEVTSTNLDTPGTQTYLAEITLCSDGTGKQLTTTPSIRNIPLFWFSPPGLWAFSKQVIQIDTVDGTCSGYFKFHGTNDDDFFGVGGCLNPSFKGRWKQVGRMSDTCPEVE